MTFTAEAKTSTTGDGGTNHRALLGDLINKMKERPASWQKAYVGTIAAWPIANETLHGETFHYFIGGEAFNWKRLAERIAMQLEEEGCEVPSVDEVLDWIAQSGTFGGLSEQEFRRILGVDGWRAHLNHFYGVHIEQCLLAEVQTRIQKRRYSRGMPPSDDSSERAFAGLYEGDEDDLWEEFMKECGPELADLMEESSGDTRSIALDEEFTYWLFKRRIENTNAPQVAAETKRGLEMMERIRDADERRIRMLKDQEGGALLEFGLVTNSNGKPRTL